MAIEEISVAELQGLLPNIVQDNVEPFLAQQPTYVICQVGGRSMRACEFAEQSGALCINIAGGTGAWIQSGFDVVLGELPNL